MQTEKHLEIAVGAFVVLGIVALLMLALKVSHISTIASQDTYTVQARFDNVGSLKVRAPVSLAGVRVGRVSKIDVDATTFQAVVTMALMANYPLPTDTSASILTAGLLGEQYIGLEPGGDEQNLAQGDTIQLTQSALVLERLVGQFLYRAAESSSGTE